MRIVLRVVGVLLVVFGCIWFLQRCERLAWQLHDRPDSMGRVRRDSGGGWNRSVIRCEETGVEGLSRPLRRGNSSSAFTPRGQAKQLTRSQ
jgi:hypothetical protein